MNKFLKKYSKPKIATAIIIGWGIILTLINSFVSNNTAIFLGLESLFVAVLILNYK